MKVEVTGIAVAVVVMDVVQKKKRGGANFNPNHNLIYHNSCPS